MLPDIGHTDDFWSYQTPAANRLINTFFDSGRVDTSLYTRTSSDFPPGSFVRPNRTPTHDATGSPTAR